MANPGSTPSQHDVIAAIRRGQIDELRALVDAGGDLHHCDEDGDDALRHAVSSEVVNDPDRLLALLRYLVENGVSPSGATTSSQSAVRVLARLGNFGAVSYLLGTGADRSPLQWTPLHEAAALGTCADIERAIAAGVSLEATDSWSRTAWLLAEKGCNTDARGHLGQSALQIAVVGGKTAMLSWLLQRGEEINQADEFGRTALQEAVECDDMASAEILLAHGADVGCGGASEPLEAARSRAMALRLLAAGAGATALSYEVQRVILGLGSPDAARLAHVSLEEFERDRTPTVGVANPTRVHSSYREAMIRAGVEAYLGRRQFDCDWPGMWPGPCFDGEGSDECATHQPDWCARRNGQSLTLVPDGRVLQIGGECEDGYHPDFCIYADVFVHHPNGAIEMYEYPRSAFQPTDFHTATLVEDDDGLAIYVIGSC
ncbi:MAG: ankyrin repeat domain-containing protein [Phycisphaerae bacterium]|nr:ankyrin repeat domain-containing protein [Phycisphaerae bacterium]